MLPPFAPFPPASVLADISDGDWMLCLDCWMLLIQGNLRLSSKEFGVRAQKVPSMFDFIISYMTESAQPDGHFGRDHETEKSLKREAFLLIHRILTEVDPVPQQLQQCTFLGDLSIVYGRHGALKSLLEFLWDRENLDGNSSTQENKYSLIQLLDSCLKAPTADIQRALLRAVALLKVSFRYGQFLMLGSDFLDALATAFEKIPSTHQKSLLAIGYFGLMSLLESRRPKISTLLDHLYSLKSSHFPSSLLRAMCSSTPLLRRLRENLSGQDTDRAQPLLQELEAFEKTSTGQLRNQESRKSNKGKDKASQAPLHDMHVHKLSLVTQIQDLFPDLGSAFIVKLLEEYDDDMEQVVTHLLEDSLPTDLKQADRTEALPHPTEPHPSLHSQEHLPLRTRRNVHDDDAFDRLAIPASSLKQGRASSPEATLPPRPSLSAKAAILSALAAFDSDSDERDDTYDATDVGGTVDSALPGTSDDIDPDRQDSNGTDDALFRAYRANPATFDRDSNTRRGPTRAALKLETGMTDEAIEGWAIMLRRDPRRLRRLEMRFSTPTGAQNELTGAADRSSAPNSADEDSDAGGPWNVGRARGQAEWGPGRGRGRGRGHGRGRGRAGSDVAGPANERATQIARQRKDAHKGSRANHNRRDQRARKMARGGGMAG